MFKIDTLTPEEQVRLRFLLLSIAFVLRLN